MHPCYLSHKKLITFVKDTSSKFMNFRVENTFELKVLKLLESTSFLMIHNYCNFLVLEEIFKFNNHFYGKKQCVIGFYN